MKKIILKFIAFFLIIGFSRIGLFAIGETAAYFNDAEISENNIFQAGTLDFELHSTVVFSPEVNLGQDSLRTIIVNDFSTTDYNYRVKVKNPVGDLCPYLFLKDNISGAPQQPLASFVSNEVLYPDESEWIFTAFLDTTNPGWEGKVCNFDFVYEGWQNNMNYGEGGFTDEEIISGMVESEGEIAPPPPGQGDVIINEVMWMGSKKNNGTNKSLDEWIELYNITNHKINIGQCEIENARSSGNPPLMIPANKIILPNDYFLIANYPETSANSALNVEVDEVNASISLQNNYNTNGALILKNKEKTVIDSTPVPAGNDWPAGENNSEEKWSMERNSDGLGWHTCDTSYMTEDQKTLMKSYWDSDAQDYNCGTPGVANLSKNDPSNNASYDLDDNK